MMDTDSSTILVRVWLFGAFHVERRNEAGIRETSDKSHWEKGYTRPLFKRLLSAGGRRLERLTLIDDLWPHPESPELVERYLNDAAYQLRKALRPAQLLKTFGHASGYALADQSLLWVDADACEALMKEAEQIGRTSAPALPLLEQAKAHFARGDFLEGESGLWVYARRGTLERLHSRCRIWLAEAYEQQGMSGQAEMLYSALLEDTPSDEDVLCRLMGLLHRQGMSHAALRCYEETKKQLKHLGQRLSPTTDAFAKRFLSEPRQVELYTEMETSNPTFPDKNRPLAQLSLRSSTTQDIIEEQELEGTDMNHLRRQIIQQALRVTGAAVITDDIWLNTDIAERLSRVLAKPSSIDERILFYLDKRLRNYWQERNDAVLPTSNLLPFVIADIQRVTTLLEGSLSPNIRTHLCDIAGTAAMLIGELYYDMSNYEQARKFQNIAIRAAHEANNVALEIVAWGRKSFAWTYDGNTKAALNCIQMARTLANNLNPVITVWLAAVEAEIQANIGNHDACLKALRVATNIEDQNYDKAESYWIHFDRSLAAGYQGISFLKLSRFGQKNLINNAQTALKDALDLLDPSMKRRQPTLLVDLAGTYIQQRNIEQACECALQAMDIAAQIKSQVSLQRLHTLREDLEPWKETQYVINLDNHIYPLFTQERH